MRLSYIPIYGRVMDDLLQEAKPTPFLQQLIRKLVIKQVTYSFCQTDCFRNHLEDFSRLFILSKSSNHLKISLPCFSRSHIHFCQTGCNHGRYPYSAFPGHIFIFQNGVDSNHLEDILTLLFQVTYSFCQTG
ncbi:hypothetical protein CEXT_214241 [Caerostris extrusa]|uniref:Uncharacterized protein n=1 Tax=Caerostris extrusa TaxID=172846 RepID=A0AAV4XIH7_CAEEX|nr:hypothetical protein CEXT_214241 [Caerostris extrusa]